MSVAVVPPPPLAPVHHRFRGKSALLPTRAARANHSRYRLGVAFSFANIQQNVRTRVVTVPCHQRTKWFLPFVVEWVPPRAIRCPYQKSLTCRRAPCHPTPPSFFRR